MEGKKSSLQFCQSPPPSPGAEQAEGLCHCPDEEPVRRSCRLEERKRAALGAFRALPCEILQFVLSFLPARSLSQLALVSSGWRSFLQEWLQLRSTAWIVSPARRFPGHGDAFYDEYTELGILCRRVIASPALPLRVHAFWSVLKRIERANLSHHEPDQYEPSFVATANFFKAAVPLNCCRSPGERFEAMWQIVRDCIGDDYLLLHQPAGREAARETDLRLALRVLFLSPSPPARHANTARFDRGFLLRALLSKLPEPQQAALIFLCYGPRSGDAIEWNRPCDVVFCTLAQMAHVVAEMGMAIEALARNSTPESIFNLVRRLTKTPRPWLPRYEVTLLLTMGPRAAGAVLAGYAVTAPEAMRESRFISTRMAQMLSLAQLYKSKLTSGEQYTGPILTAASMDILQVLQHFFRFVPEDAHPKNLVDDVATQAFFLAFNVGGTHFVGHVMDVINPILHYYQGKLNV
ncbi:uncharacterized protein LOC117653311 isoform X2 [Thrips palmi]|uniref:Uncharacterized protein LOC117653311 isoform X2 n=1 Tax=Thrips palmi TaxID=161013 RepID=A0A6P9A9S7_THRPL|nr:uncharacterized protein LOC117653311 isoform X2 [Thrips palmi]